MSKKPNVIFVWADQLGYRFTGFGGHKLVATPNLDKFAAQGANFTSAISNTPVCGPFRACALTGRYGHASGVISNSSRLPEAEKVFAEILKDQGYVTGYVGKWHLSGPANDHEPPGPGRHNFDYWSSYEFYHKHNHTLYWEDEEPIEEDEYQADSETRRAIEFMNKHAGSDEPFCLCLSWGPPHPPYDAWMLPPKYLHKYGTVEEMPESEQEPDSKDWMWRPWQTPVTFTPNKVIPVEENASGKRHTDMMAAIYYAQTEWVDDCFGRLMDALDETGQAENTIVVFTSDHGEMLGSHGLRGKMIYYDESVRIPFLTRYPGTIPAGTESDACISSVDFMPTLLGLAGVASPANVQGMDLSHCAKGAPGPEPEAAAICSYTGYSHYGPGWEHRGVRTKRYTYSRSLCQIKRDYGYWREGDTYSHAPELFLSDNEKDPLQMKNVYEEPEYKAVVDEMEALLQDHLDASGDLFLPGPDYRKYYDDEGRLLRPIT
jgi:arylsulfatase A-like enzyme